MHFGLCHYSLWKYAHHHGDIRTAHRTSRGQISDPQCTCLAESCMAAWHQSVTFAWCYQTHFTTVVCGCCFCRRRFCRCCRRLGFRVLLAAAAAAVLIPLTRRYFCNEQTVKAFQAFHGCVELLYLLSCDFDSWVIISKYLVPRFPLPCFPLPRFQCTHTLY